MPATAGSLGRSSRRAMLAGLVAALLIVAGTTTVAVLIPGHNVPGEPVAAPVPTTSTYEPPPEPEEDDPEKVVVKAKDGKSQLTMPINWTEPPKAARNKEAEIQRGSDLTGRFVLVITESKRDYTSFSAFMDATTEVTRLMAAKLTIRGARKLTVGGLPAVQRKVSGRIDGINFVYWIMLVNGNKGYHQVVGWTVRSLAEKNEDAILEVMASFRETTGRGT